MTIYRLSTEQIEAKIDQLAESPNDNGVLESIVLRLPDEHRDTPRVAEVSPEGGLHGDRWGIVKTPNVRAQISVMNSRFLRLVAGSEHRMPLAGDNLLVDFNLSEDNLPTGTQLKIGTATFEVTDLPHTGCAKFERRYGSEALEFVNADAYAAQKLRGLFVRVIEPGQIQVGDTISKIEG